MSAIGFDIGNESCVIAAFKDGAIDIIINDDAKRETPTVICFGDKQRFIGSTGAAFASKYPNSTFSDLKSMLSDASESVKLQYLSKEFHFTPTEMMAMIFSHLKQTAERHLGSPLANCVIGIPSYFHDKQRRAYLTAAKIAGLNPLRLLHDCTAAALSYGFYRTDASSDKPRIVAFVDVGQCDTQVSIAHFKDKEVKIMSHSSDRSLGGRDFDEVIFRHFSEQFKEKYKLGQINPKALKRLRLECMKVKKVLSANTEASLNIECFMNDEDVEGSIKRQEFDNLCLNLLRRIENTCRQALKDSSPDCNCVDSVELMGSGSRIPSISKVVASVFNKEPNRTLNASECIARGCALQCAFLTRTSSNGGYGIKDSIPFSIKSSKGLNFQKNDNFPVTKSLTIQTKCPLQLHIFDEQDSVINIITIDDSKRENNNRVTVEAEFKLDINGIVKVLSAKLEKDNKERNFLRRLLKPLSCMLSYFQGSENESYMLITESGNGEMSEADVSKAKKKQAFLTETDQRVGRVNESKNALESYVYDFRNKLKKKYESIVRNEERSDILTKLKEIEEWIYEDDHEKDADAYVSKLRELEKLHDPILRRYQEED